MELSARASEARPVDVDSVPAHLLCKACSKWLINCFQTLHGCRLCKNCKSRLDSSNECTCECSDEERRLASQATSLPDTGTRRELGEVLVHCPNCENGCQVQLRWKQVELHLSEKCEFETVTCESCSRLVVLCKLQTSHRNLQSADCCPAFSAFHCPLCDDSSRWLNRSAFVEHLKTCLAALVECKYRCVGCQEVAKRKDMKEHYSCCTDAHLELAVEQKDEKLREMVARVVKLEQQKEADEVRKGMEEAAAHEMASHVKQLQKENEAFQWRIRLLEINESKQMDEKKKLDDRLGSMGARMIKLEQQKEEADEARKVMEEAAVEMASHAKQLQKENEDLQRRLHLLESNESKQRDDMKQMEARLRQLEGHRMEVDETRKRMEAAVEMARNATQKEDTLRVQTHRRQLETNSIVSLEEHLSQQGPPGWNERKGYPRRMSLPAPNPSTRAPTNKQSVDLASNRSCRQEGRKPDGGGPSKSSMTLKEAPNSSGKRASEDIDENESENGAEDQSGRPLSMPMSASLNTGR